jgi:hypothetical protein
VMKGKGTDVCVQGAVADMFYLIIVGSCGIIINDQQVGTLHELDVFGEKALFPNTQGQNIRGATVRMVTDELHVLTLKKKKFDALVAGGAFDMKCMAKLKLVMGQRAKNDSEREKQSKEQETNAVKKGQVEEKASVLEQNDKLYVKLVQSSLNALGKRKLETIKKAAMARGMHDVPPKLMLVLIKKMKVAPPSNVQMEAIFHDAGVQNGATSMAWSELYLWLGITGPGEAGSKKKSTSTEPNPSTINYLSLF